MSRKKAAKEKSPLPLFIIGGVLVVALIAGVILIGSNRKDAGGGASGQPGPAAAQQIDEQASKAAPGAQLTQARGPENAPVIIEEFGDYQCPSCAMLHPVIHKIENDYGNRVRVIFRQYPLPMHRNASLAARAAVAASLQGHFWPMHDNLYERQGEWSELPDPRPKFTEYAQRIGLDVGRFRTDLESREVGALIFEDMKRANALRISGTPTIILNGRILTAEQTMRKELLLAEIEKELAAKGK